MEVHDAEQDPGSEDRGERGDDSALVPLARVADELGTTADVIRGWERRYGLVVGARRSGRRVYSPRQVEELRWLLAQVRAGIRPQEAHRLLQESRLPRVGAQALAPTLPPFGTLARRFHLWAASEPALPGMLDRAREAAGLRSAFLVVNILHPEAGPAGTIVVLRTAQPVTPWQARIRMLTTIPFTEMGDYPERWARGETVLVHVEDMPPPLRVRYAATPIAWSLNIPVFVRSEWVGVVGGTSNEERPGPDALSVYEALRDLVRAEFEAEEARRSFEAGAGSEPRSLGDQP